MSFDPDVIADRQRLRRKVSLWRVLGILGLLAGVVAAGLATAGTGPLRANQPQIARISVTGVITGDQRTTDLLKRVGEARNVAGVVISINSPGGTTTGSEELFRGIRDLAAKKPLVAFVDGTAASGGYIAALGADRIVARETALVGSIGVLFQYPDLSRLLDTLGVKVESVKSTPLKAEPSPFNPTSPEAREALQRVVNDTYDWFKTLVAERRRFGAEEIGAAADGRVFNGRQALGLKLVDQLGTERDAVAWLEAERGVATGLPVRSWKPRGEGGYNIWTGAAAGADLLGFDEVAAHLRQASAVSQESALSGLLVLWRPTAEQQR